MRRLLCLFLMITLCPLLSAAAEEPGTMIPEVDLQSQEQIFESLRPLLELTTAASVSQSDEAFAFQKGDTMPLSFAEAVISMAPRYGIDLTGQDTEEFLASRYAMTISQVPEAKEDTSERYTGLFMLSCVPDPSGQEIAITAEVYQAPRPYGEMTDEDWHSFVWLDTVAVMTLDQVEEGGRITSLTYMPTYFSDDTDALPTSPEESDLSYLYDEQYHYSVPYPAEFDEANPEITQDGLKGELADGSAFLQIRREDKNARTLDMMTQAWLVEHQDATLLSSEIDHMQCVSFTDGSRTGMWFVAESDDSFVWVCLTWDESVHPEYLEIVGRMMSRLVISDDQQG